MKSCPQCSSAYPDDYSLCPKDGTRLTSTSLWQPGSVIRGKYKILAKIGEGGMAAVYRAQHQLLDEVRALKVIKAELARDAQFVQRFKNEAIIMRKLQHPNAVRVDDLDIAEDGRPFIAMELAQGDSLRNVIHRTGPLPVSRVLDIALQVCEALQAAHALGLVHRDIKPENMVLISRGESTPLVKILDFGIARLREGTLGAGQAALTLTGTGVVIGTPEYMSPEQAMGKRGSQLDGRSDLYSLGIVMYRALTGELPFKADSTMEMLIHHIQTVPHPPQVLKPQLGIPESVSAVVMKALEKDPEGRFATASAMAEALRQAQETLAGASRSAELAPTIPLVTPLARPDMPKATPPTPPEARESIAPGVQKEGQVPVTPPQPQPAAPPGYVRPYASPAAQRRGIRWRYVVLGILALVLALAAIQSWKHRQAIRTDRTSVPPASESVTKPEDKASTAVTPVTTPETQGTAPSSAPQKTQEGPISSRESRSGQEIEPVRSPVSSAQGSTAPGAPIHPQSTREGLAPQPVSEAQQDAVQEPGSYPQPPPRQRELLDSTERQRIRQLNAAGTQHLLKGDYQRAARAFYQVLAIDPDNKYAQRGLQKCKDMIRRGQQPERGRPSPSPDRFQRPQNQP